jgi:hypothetical protein
MTPHAFYKGPMGGLSPTLTQRCMYCDQPFPWDEQIEYCSITCAEDHDTVQKGGTPLPEHERCSCDELDTMIPRPRHAGHFLDCPRYLPHPQDYSHPLENT